MENPFSLTFGQKPTEFISRTNQIDKIILTFDMEITSNKVFMITGVRGSGKTVSLAGAVSELTRIFQFHNLDLGLNLNLGIAELSELDRKIVYVISTGVCKTGEIREKLAISPQLLNIYRKRLMERGVVNGSVRGELTLALPRFEEYIEMYCEVNI